MGAGLAGIRICAAADAVAAACAHHCAQLRTMCWRWRSHSDNGTTKTQLSSSSANSVHSTDPSALNPMVGATLDVDSAVVCPAHCGAWSNATHTASSSIARVAMVMCSQATVPCGVGSKRWLNAPFQFLGDWFCSAGRQLPMVAAN